MKTLSFFLTLLLFTTASFAQHSKEDQINMALLAAPEEARAGATVYGWNDNGDYVVLRKGNNGYIVRSDDFKKAGFEVVCYKEDVEPFMARGRELRAEGKNFRQVLDQREEEAKSGKLKMPSTGSTLHIFFGKDAKYNPTTKTLENVSYRSVIYMPLSTAESTGLPTKPMVDGQPWIMYPGMHRAHIMIMPPKGN